MGQILQLITICIILAVESSETRADEDTDCSTVLWSTTVNGSCTCNSIPGVQCSNASLLVQVGYCMSKDGNGQPVLGKCPYFATNPILRFTTAEGYEVPVNTNVSKLNHLTCGHLNRHGQYCELCVNGHGPATFSDSMFCADCSKYMGVWLLYFLFQILLETILLGVLTVVNLSQESVSLINVLAFYWQMILYAITSNSSLYHRLLQNSNSEILQLLLTIYGIWNLDFLRYLMPPMCIHHTTKAINMLWFDVLVGLYPFLLCTGLLLCGHLYNQHVCNQIFAFIIRPLRKTLKREWNLKNSVLGTFSTFLVLGYSKLLFTSLKFLCGVHVYNSNGTLASKEPILYYDPSVEYLSSQHVPYVIISVIILFTFILIPPLILILHTMRCFRKCISFQRSAFQTNMIDGFQDFYENGVDGTFDYHLSSALYMVLRVGMACVYTFAMMVSNDRNTGLPWAITGMVLLSFGAFFFIAEPLRIPWRNKFDGFLLTLLGLLALTIRFEDPLVYVIALVVSLKPWAILGTRILIKLSCWSRSILAIKRLARKFKELLSRCLKCEERNEEEEPLLEELVSDTIFIDKMPSVNPPHNNLGIRSSQATKGTRSTSVPTYGVVKQD